MAMDVLPPLFAQGCAWGCRGEMSSSQPCCPGFTPAQGGLEDSRATGMLQKCTRCRRE